MSARPRVAFLLEQTLGHITHADNLTRLIGADDRIRAEFVHIDFEMSGVWERLPGYGNWTVRAGLRARRALRSLERGGALDALFVHTQVPATLMPDVLARIPTIVSLDATPKQYDELGDHYSHSRGSERIERVKEHLHRGCFSRAARLVAWSRWTKAGLVDGYGVPAEKVVVIAPGVDFERWASAGAGASGRDAESPVRVLFVGGDLRRKGGLVLVDAIRSLRAGGVDVELDLVTRDPIAAGAGIRVHQGLAPNSKALIDLYRGAHVFCLPTLGDCLPMVLSEAGATGLPLVSTDVGAIREIARPDETGLLVPPTDEVALADAIGRLVATPSLRRSLGANARRLVHDEFNAATNASRLVELIVETAQER